MRFCIQLQLTTLEPTFSGLVGRPSNVLIARPHLLYDADVSKINPKLRFTKGANPSKIKFSPQRPPHRGDDTPKGLTNQ